MFWLEHKSCKHPQTHSIRVASLRRPKSSSCSSKKLCWKKACRGPPHRAVAGQIERSRTRRVCPTLVLVPSKLPDEISACLPRHDQPPLEPSMVAVAAPTRASWTAKLSGAWGFLPRTRRKCGSFCWADEQQSIRQACRSGYRQTDR